MSSAVATDFPRPQLASFQPPRGVPAQPPWESVMDVAQIGQDMGFHRLVQLKINRINQETSAFTMKYEISSGFSFIQMLGGIWAVGTVKDKLEGSWWIHRVYGNPTTQTSTNGSRVVQDSFSASLAAFSSSLVRERHTTARVAPTLLRTRGCKFNDEVNTQSRVETMRNITLSWAYKVPSWNYLR